MNISSIGYAATSTVTGTFSPADTTNRVATDTQNNEAAAKSAPASEPGKQASHQDLQQAVKVMNDFVGTLNNSLNFTVDGETGKTVVKVMDMQTNEVIKQIPSEEMLAMAHAIDKLKGLLVHQKA